MLEERCLFLLTIKKEQAIDEYYRQVGGSWLFCGKSRKMHFSCIFSPLRTCSVFLRYYLCSGFENDYEKKQQKPLWKIKSLHDSEALFNRQHPNKFNVLCSNQTFLPRSQFFKGHKQKKHLYFKDIMEKGNWTVDWTTGSRFGWMVSHKFDNGSMLTFLGGGRSFQSVGRTLRVMDTIGIVGMFCIAGVLLCV